MDRGIAGIAASTLCAASVVCAAAVFKVLPVDEAGDVPSFEAYRTNLRAAIVSRDARKVIEMSHPGLHQLLRLGLRSPTHEYWSELEELLRLGGTFSKDHFRVLPADQRPMREFCAPYVWSLYPTPGEIPDELVGEVEPWVILGSGVAVRDKPSTNAPIITRLAHELVHLVSTANPHGGQNPEWMWIVAPSGRKGYVSSRLIRDPADYHACFGEFPTGWLMIDFSQGSVR